MSDLIVVGTPTEWQRLKALVLDSVSSPITRRVYNKALDEFMAWCQQIPRSGFTKATVQRLESITGIPGSRFVDRCPSVRVSEAGSGGGSRGNPPEREANAALPPTWTAASPRDSGRRTLRRDRGNEAANVPVAVKP